MKKQQSGQAQQEQQVHEIEYPSDNNYPGDSINEHQAIETANVLIAEKEIGQQNENL